MPDQTIAHTLIHAAAIGGIMVLWLELTANAAKNVVQLSKEMFVDKGAEERKRRREIEQEVRRTIAEEKEFYKRIEEEG